MVVVCAHLILHFDGIYGFSNFKLGAKAHPGFVHFLSTTPVLFFFMISGFVISMTLKKAPTIRTFALWRFARLFPAYWAALILAICLYWFSAIFTVPPVVNIVANAFMLQGFIGVENIDPVYWSLGHELGFYLLCAIFIAGREYRPVRLLKFAFVWLAAASVAQLLSSGISNDNAGLAQFTRNAPYFCAGIGFYLWRVEGLSRESVALTGASLIAAALFNPVGGAAATAMLWIAFFGVVTGRAGWLNWAPLLFLGRISYSLYLVHLPVGYLLVHSIDRAGVHSAAAIALGVSCAVGVASLVHFGVEKPGQKFFRKFAETPAGARPTKSAALSS